MSIIEQAYTKYLRYDREQKDIEYAKRKHKNKGWAKGTLWPSDVGKCHRAAILRVTGVQRHDNIDTRGLDYMNTGVVAEDVTLKALQYTYGDRLTDQVILKYQMWSGKADFGIDIGTDKPILIEHKMTSEKHFDSDSKTVLPRHEHLGQAMTYMYLYERIYGITPEVYIMYKAWGVFAEFKLERFDDKILITDEINGVINVREYKHDYYKEIRTLMEEYDSVELPSKLDKKHKGCEFMGKPSCAFYKECWGEKYG